MVTFTVDRCLTGHCPAHFHLDLLIEAPSLSPGGQVDMSEGWAQRRSPPPLPGERALSEHTLESECPNPSHRSLASWPQIKPSVHDPQEEVSVGHSEGVVPCIKDTF